MAKGWDNDPSLFAGMIEEDVGKKLHIISMALLTEIVQRSPVGNPELWNINQDQVKNRNRVSDINHALRNSDQFGYEDSKGNRRIKPGNKVQLGGAVYSNNAGRFGPQRIRKLLRGQGEIYSPAGYIGGMFRASHIVSVGSPDMSEPSAPDPNGSTTISNGRSIIDGAGPYSMIYIQSNLPYSERLEEGHSRQAPIGVYAVSFHGVTQAYK